jgi:hypothetical protein
MYGHLVGGTVQLGSPKIPFCWEFEWQAPEFCMALIDHDTAQSILR